MTPQEKNEKQMKKILPPIDIYENDNEYVIKADMPGVKKENVNIIFENNELSIEGIIKEEEDEKSNLKYGEYSLSGYFRDFRTGNDIDSNKINASLDLGVLTLILPKKEEVKPRKIEVSLK